MIHLDLKKVKVMICAMTIAILGNITGTTVFAADKTQMNSNIAQQILVEENEYNDNGSIMHEYIWKDSPSVSIMIEASSILSEAEQLDYATWKTSNEKAGTLKHRAAKITPILGSGKWYACSQTQYAAWHYSRARIIKTLTGKILEDSNQVQVQTGTATARTPKDKLYLGDIDYSMRSYWGT